MFSITCPACKATDSLYYSRTETKVFRVYAMPSANDETRPIVQMSDSIRDSYKKVGETFCTHCTYARIGTPQTSQVVVKE